MIRHGIVEIGNAHGKIAIYCDEGEAWDLYHMFSPEDSFRRDIAYAIQKAYPPPSDDDPQLGIEIRVRRGA